MKPCLRPDGGLEKSLDMSGYRCGLRLALGANPSFSFCLDSSDQRHLVPQRINHLRSPSLAASTKATKSNMAAKMVDVFPM